MQELEIKLFIITKFFDALYDGDTEKIKDELRELLHTKDMEADYWDRWLNRYETIIFSKEVQVTLLRRLDYSYRKIQRIVGTAPNTIQNILARYDLDYEPLPDTILLEDSISRLSARLERGGILLW